MRGGILSESTYGRACAKARVIAFTDAQAASTLAERPYDLREPALRRIEEAGAKPDKDPQSDLEAAHPVASPAP